VLLGKSILVMPTSSWWVAVQSVSACHGGKVTVATAAMETVSEENRWRDWACDMRSEISGIPAGMTNADLI